MNGITEVAQEGGTPVVLPEMKRIWQVCIGSGALLWVIGLLFWWQAWLDTQVLLSTTPLRAAHTPLIVVSRWLTDYGMAVITGIYVLYLLGSMLWERLDAPMTLYFYAICSLGLSGVAGDLIKEALARPRPLETFGSQIVALSQSVTPSIPSGHATKSIALILPFLLLAPGNNRLHRAIKIIVSLMAVGVCISRVMLGAHYVSDVIAGAGMALIGLPFSMLFANMIFRQTKSEQLPFLSKVWAALLVLLTFLFMNM